MASYLHYINNFWKTYNTQNIKSRLNSFDTTFYFYLLQKANLEGKFKRDCPLDIKLEVATNTITYEVGINRSTLTKCRNRLKQAGLIDFIEGKRHLSAFYIIFSVVLIDTNSYTNVDTNSYSLKDIKDIKDLKENIYNPLTPFTKGESGQEKKFFESSNFLESENSVTDENSEQPLNFSEQKEDPPKVARKAPQKLREKPPEPKPKQTARRKKPKASESEYFQQIAQIWERKYHQTRQIEYQLAEKDYVAISKIQEIFRKIHPDNTTAEMLELYDWYFTQVLSITENNWLYQNMSLTLLQSKFNEINSYLKNGNSRLNSTKSKLATKFAAIDDYIASRTN